MRRNQFALTQGTLQRFASSASGMREYCPQCGTHILVHGQTADDSVAVPAGTLDGQPQVVVTAHIFVQDKVDWHTIIDKLPQHAGWPPGVAVPHAD